MPTFAISLFSHNITDPYNGFVNVFGYVGPDMAYTQSVFDDFVAQWTIDVLAPLQIVTVSAISYDKMQMRSVDGTGWEFEHVFSPPYHGNVDQECLPFFNAWAFQYNRSVSGQRSGAKRFAGVPESLQANGIVNGAGAPLVANLATALQGDIDAGTETYTPVILHKTGPSTAEPHYIAGVQYKRISTQNSRKR